MVTLRRNFPAFWAALFAVLLQLSWGQAVAAPQAALHICGQADHAPAPPHNDMDCAHCPLCAGMVAIALILPPVASAPPAAVRQAADLAWAPRRAAIRAPPVSSTSPRGPPRLF